MFFFLEASVWEFHDGILHTDIGDGGSDADFDARVAFLCELSLEELVELGVEDAVGDELSALGDGTGLRGCGGHVG